MEIKLNVSDRIALFGIINPEGNYLVYKMLMDLKSDLSFNDKEFKDFGIVQRGINISWQKSIDKEFEIPDTAIKIIQDALTEIEKNKKLNPGTGPLYEKFILNLENNKLKK